MSEVRALYEPVPPGSRLARTLEGLDPRFALNNLDDFSRREIELRYGLLDGRPLMLKEVGEKLHCSGVYAHKVETKALISLREIRDQNRPEKVFKRSKIPEIDDAYLAPAIPPKFIAERLERQSKIMDMRLGLSGDTPMTITRIAEVLGISEKTVARSIARASRELPGLRQAQETNVQHTEASSNPVERPKGYQIKPTKLQAALGELSVEEVLPHLSAEEKTVLATRFNLLEGGRKRKSIREAAKFLGFSVNEIFRIESEAIEQIAYMATSGRPKEGSS